LLALQKTTDNTTGLEVYQSTTDDNDTTSTAKCLAIKQEKIDFVADDSRARDYSFEFENPAELDVDLLNETSYTYSFSETSLISIPPSLLDTCGCVYLEGLNKTIYFNDDDLYVGQEDSHYKNRSEIDPNNKINPEDLVGIIGH